MYRINVNIGSSYLSLRVPMQSGRGNLGLAVMPRLLRGVYPERDEILRFAQNDSKRRARNDTGKTAMTTFIHERS